jgi:hypothetical protein
VKSAVCSIREEIYFGEQVFKKMVGFPINPTAQFHSIQPLRVSINYTKLYNDQSSAQAFRLFTNLLLPYMFITLAVIQVSWVWWGR